jgi:hypothetical protein
MSVGVLVSVSPSFYGKIPLMPDKIELNRGDTVLFIGDSITDADRVLPI